MSRSLPSEVWSKFLSGDTSSFEKLFKGYYKSMFGYGMKLCNNSEIVEDSIQELFEAIWNKRDNLDHITSPNVYLFVSLRRNILKKRNKKNHTRFMKDGECEDFLIYFGQEELIIKKESRINQKKLLQKALNQLSNQQKEVIYLHYYNGMSYSEIERILSINRQSVRNHMYRAMETLRSVLSKDVMRLVICFLASFLYATKFLI